MTILLFFVRRRRYEAASIFSESVAPVVNIISEGFAAPIKCITLRLAAA